LQQRTGNERTIGEVVDPIKRAETQRIAVAASVHEARDSGWPTRAHAPEEDKIDAIVGAVVRRARRT